MSQQYPQPQQQPGWGGPQQGWGAPPPPPKKTSAGKIVGFGCLGIVALFIILGAIGAAGGSGSSSTDTSSKDKPAAAHSAPKKSGHDKAPAKVEKTQAEEFRACVAKSGTPTERAAVKHVTKVTGTDKRNDVLDAAEVYTDFTGGFMSGHSGDAKLIASAFASCYESKNGLVTVYGSDGDMIANGNY